MRRLTVFQCEGETLVGSLDEAPGTTGLVIVSGGNEPRMGAHRGMALLAGRIAGRGWPVFRFDRRGVGDSSGENRGWASSGPDITAAVAQFRNEVPALKQLIGFGNCDAATALALFGASAGIDALVLANPWMVERQDDLPPPAAIRARYAERLRKPHSLLKGGDPRKLVRGLRALLTPSPPNTLPNRFAEALRQRDATIVLAKGDATAIAYADAVRTMALPLPLILQTDSHSFARPGDAEALEQAIVAMLERYSAASASSSNSA